MGVRVSGVGGNCITVDPNGYAQIPHAKTTEGNCQATPLTPETQPLKPDHPIPYPLSPTTH